MSGRPLRRLVALLAGCVVASGLVIIGAIGPAFACTPGFVTDSEGNVTYNNCEDQPGDEGTGTGTGGGGNAEPSCTFTGIWDEFCRGNAPCYQFDPANLQDDDFAREGQPNLPERPSEDDHLIFVSCLPPGGERQDLYYWASQFEEGVSTRDRLLAAYGQLNLPNVTPVFNPPVRTLVNLDTWWWAEGGSAAPIVGTEALGLVAIAEPQSMIVTAGGQTVTCPVVTKKSDECRLVFRRAGDYPAEMQITYGVRFELGGQPFAIPGGNNDLLSIESTDTVTVPVREVQSRVTAAG